MSECARFIVSPGYSSAREDFAQVFLVLCPQLRTPVQIRKQVEHNNRVYNMYFL